MPNQVPAAMATAEQSTGQGIHAAGDPLTRLRTLLQLFLDGLECSRLDEGIVCVFHDYRSAFGWCAILRLNLASAIDVVILAGCASTVNRGANVRGVL